MKQRILWIVVVVLVLIVIAGGGWFWLRYETSGFSALQQPSAFEEFSALAARKVAMPRRAHDVCHANDGSGDTEMGAHMYPRAPDMREKRTQQLTDGEIFFIIENGIRLSGMPGWHAPGQEEDTWKLVRFIRHLPQISPEEIDEMENLNPKGPEEREEEKEEQEFLNGGQPSAATTPKHH